MNRLLLLLLISLMVGVPEGFATSAYPEIPGILSASLAESVERFRKGLAASEPRYQRAYDRLYDRAEEALLADPVSVLDKKRVAPSGDQQDYLSLAPYWWPDPEEPDGLPWIRRDGEVNPVTRGENTDVATKNKFTNDCRTLILAYLISDDERFGIKASELLDVWFVQPDSRMNPHLNYAQGIPGRNEGRGFGIIELAGFSELLAHVELLAKAEMLKESIYVGVMEWSEAYLEWLRRSPFGKFEASRKNNHAVWYDVQYVAFSLFLGETNKARKKLKKVPKRIASQIEADGRQPHELERTKSLSYSTMNLRAFTRLTYYGRLVGEDIWAYESKQGGSLPNAYAFLRPFVFDDKEWTWEQLGDWEKTKKGTQRLFLEAGTLLNVKEYYRLGATALSESDDLSVLLFW